MKRSAILLLLSLLASVTGARAAEGKFDVQLVEPAAGVDFLAGSTASINWEAADMPADVEEWEAFLSIDGGVTFPIRLTPHLDRTIHHFSWIVPSLPGAGVTLLLRFGDEGDERQFSFRGRMRIEGVSLFERLRYEMRPEDATVSEKDDHGETVVEWVEGWRDGSHLRQVVAGEPLVGGQGEIAVPLDRETVAAVGSEPRRLDPAARRWPEISADLRPAIAAPQRSAGRHATDVLRLSGRLNI
jgi:hypothetical protein